MRFAKKILLIIFIYIAVFTAVVHAEDYYVYSYLSDGNYIVTANQPCEGKIVVISFYNDKVLLKADSQMYEGVELSFKAPDGFDRANITLWNDLNDMVPLINKTDCVLNYYSDDAIFVTKVEEADGKTIVTKYPDSSNEEGNDIVIVEGYKNVIYVPENPKLPNSEDLVIPKYNMDNVKYFID